MNFTSSFYTKMKSELSESAYLKAFEIAKWLEGVPRSEWADTIHKACSNNDYMGSCGVAVESWFNRNLIWI